MNEKRRDTKGRILRNGEMQRPDGRYMFRYADVDGSRRTVYSWKLVETDALPSGKRCKEALRTIEQRVLKDLDDGIYSNSADNTTVNMLFKNFMEVRTELKESTRVNYAMLYNKHIRDGFGKKKISNIKYSDVYKFYLELNSEAGLRVSSIQKINAILWQLFEAATRDNLIRRNPSEGAMKEAAHKIKEEPQKRHALTIDEQSSLLDYIYKSNRYRRYGHLVTVLLGTGMRIGEALGLTWGDIDFKNNVINVSHSLSYKPTEQSGYEYHVSSTKTKAGVRKIPMLQDVRKTFQKELRVAKHRRDAVEFNVDGYSGFIFLNTVGKSYTPTFIFDVIQNIVADYNRDEMLSSSREGREPHYIPKISAHTFRHTFCTRLCENESNLKIIQEVMGHKNIRTTMNVYSEATAQAMQSSFQNLEGKIKIV